MPLSSASTTAQVLAAYADNASYEENDSLAEGRAFVSACRMLLSPAHSFKRSASGGGKGSEVELSQDLLMQQLDQARRWVAAKQEASSGGVTHADFTGFRD
jgi:hypothetical protein